jgi:hypothetical protein
MWAQQNIVILLLVDLKRKRVTCGMHLHRQQVTSGCAAAGPVGLLLSVGRALVQNTCAAYFQYSICLFCNTLRWVCAALAGGVVVSLQIDRAIAKQYHLWGAESPAMRVSDR